MKKKKTKVTKKKNSMAKKKSKGQGGECKPPKHPRVRTPTKFRGFRLPQEDWDAFDDWADVRGYGWTESSKAMKLMISEAIVT